MAPQPEPPQGATERLCAVGRSIGRERTGHSDPSVLHPSLREGRGTRSRTRTHTRTQRARAFTIVELVVSIGVLGLLAVLAGTIFSLTLRSSGQANALIEVKQAIRVLEQTLREDLRYVQPGSSLMIIQGNRINAYWTADAREEDNDNNPTTPLSGGRRDPERETTDAAGTLFTESPRADVLMFFTARPSRSFVTPSITGRLQQVCYGHAELGDLQANGVWSVAPPPLTAPPPAGRATFVDAQFDPTVDLSASVAAWVHATPARQWHLARRTVLIVDQDVPAGAPTDLDDSQLPSPDTNYIRDGRWDFVADNFFADNTDDFEFATEVRDYVADLPGDAHADVRAVQVAATGNLIPWFARSQMDVDPPSKQAHRLGHYMLPNCASFKVEWLLSPDDPVFRELFAGMIRMKAEPFWFDPGNFAASYAQLDDWTDSFLDTFTDPLIREALRLGFRVPLLDQFDPANFQNRFWPEEVGSNHVFYARIEVPAVPVSMADPLFPPALRITVDVYDRAGRLERPIRHVMILPIGEG